MDALSAEERAYLAKCGVPGEMVEQVENLIDELNGAIAAEGWSDPDGQARFLAGRLEHHAAKLRELAR